MECKKEKEPLSSVMLKKRAGGRLYMVVPVTPAMAPQINLVERLRREGEERK